MQEVKNKHILLELQGEFQVDKKSNYMRWNTASDAK